MRLLRLAAAPLLLAASLAHAQPAPPDDSLYRAFGGQAGLVRLMDDLGERLLADARMKPFFADADLAHVKEELVLQFCELGGGPCRRSGPGMREAHDGMEIRRADFNALVEVLQDAMAAQGIPWSAQTRMLARLAPMHREIVNQH